MNDTDYSHEVEGSGRFSVISVDGPAHDEPLTLFTWTGSNVKEAAEVLRSLSDGTPPTMPSSKSSGTPSNRSK
jgi:hypothetical protein